MVAPGNASFAAARVSPQPKITSLARTSWVRRHHEVRQKRLRRRPASVCECLTKRQEFAITFLA